jgi:hypothetical protein
MKPDNVSCKTCVFFQPVEGLLAECHRRAPTFVTHNIRRVNGDDGKVSEPVAYFPETSADEWCGEWRGQWWVEPKRSPAPAKAKKGKAAASTREVD